jgi:hypothetical protein
MQNPVNEGPSFYLKQQLILSILGLPDSLYTMYNDDAGHTEVLLTTTSPSFNPEELENNPESQRLLLEDDDGREVPHIEHGDRQLPAGRSFLVRMLALLCACSLSIGSH